jgi:broad specificity phosphatase PhoE
VRWIEIRRHSLTKKGPSRGHGSHLSLQGVALARAVGAGLGNFARVVTSPLPRAIETAVAMGYAVDDLLDLPSGYVPGEVAHHDQWTWSRPYVRYAELIAQGGGVSGAAAAGQAALVQLLEAIPDGEAALVISHGGTIEPLLVACMPSADHANWGAGLAHCEGARLGWDGRAFTTIELRRAPTAGSEG